MRRPVRVALVYRDCNNRTIRNKHVFVTKEQLREIKRWVNGRWPSENPAVGEIEVYIPMSYPIVQVAHNNLDLREYYRLLERVESMGLRLAPPTRRTIVDKDGIG